MTHISVDRAIKLFGVVEGIKFWFEWRIKIKIELFYYKNILSKKWCSMYGYSCNNKRCEYLHLDKPGRSYINGIITNVRKIKE